MNSNGGLRVFVAAVAALIRVSTSAQDVNVQGTVTAQNVVTSQLTVNGASVWLLPAGIILPFAGSSAPLGYLLCNGAAVSRASYATLFAAIGTTYGAGDGSTTFNLPDLRGRNPIGAGQGAGLTNRALAATGGEQAHVQALGEMAYHTHLASQASHWHSATTTANGDHQHRTGNAEEYNPWGQSKARYGYPDGNTPWTNARNASANSGGVDTLTSTSGGHSHSLSTNSQTPSITVGSAGTSVAANVMDPFLVVNFIIKT